MSSIYICVINFFVIHMSNYREFNFSFKGPSFKIVPLYENVYLY